MSHSFHHNTAGIVIGDTALCIIKLAHHAHGLVPTVYASVPVPEGAVMYGEIIDKSAVEKLFIRVARQYALRDVCIAIPFSQVLMSTIVVDAQTPVARAVSAYLEKKGIDIAVHTVEYRIRQTKDSEVVVDIHALPLGTAKQYVRMAGAAGMTVVGLFDASYARAHALGVPQELSILISIEALRTTVALIVGGSSVYSIDTVYAGAALLARVAKERDVSVHDAQGLVGRVGLDPRDTELFDLISEKVDAIVEDVTKVSVLPYQKKSTLAVDQPISRVYITGSYVQVQHLADYLSARLRIPTVLGNPWKKCFSFDNYIPAIMHDDAHQYAAAIGALMCNPTTLNLLPRIQKRLLVRRRITRRTVAIVVVCIVAILAGFGVSILMRG